MSNLTSLPHQSYYKFYCFTIFCALASCGPTYYPKEAVGLIQTKYPDRASNEFMNEKPGVARTAYPDDRGGRIWVKGSKDARSVLLKTISGKQISSKRLTKPHYTHIFSALPTNQKLVAEFRGANGSLISSRYVSTVSKKSIAKKGEHKSVLFYGCLQPFLVDPKSNGQDSIMFSEESPFAGRFMKGFAKVATDTENSSFSSVAPNPVLLVGTGDQVYMDAGYDALPPVRGQNHPLSAWSSEKQPQLMFSAKYYPEHVARTYDAFAALTHMNQVFSKIPQINAWDDHEIRDGWGSQRDENAPQKPWLKEVFAAARKGYLEHQYSLGPQGSRLNDFIGNTRFMHQTFVVGDYRGFVFDLRSERTATRVISSKQRKEFTKWLSKCDNNQRIVIVSSMPLFLKLYTKAEKITTDFDSEFDDDILDGWAAHEME